MSSFGCRRHLLLVKYSTAVAVSHNNLRLLSPAVQWRLKAFNIDPLLIKPSGPKGNILKGDILQFLQARPKSNDPITSAPTISAVSEKRELVLVAEDFGGLQHDNHSGRLSILLKVIEYAARKLSKTSPSINIRKFSSAQTLVSIQVGDQQWINVQVEVSARQDAYRLTTTMPPSHVSQYSEFIRAVQKFVAEPVFMLL